MKKLHDVYYYGYIIKTRFIVKPSLGLINLRNNTFRNHDSAVCSFSVLTFVEILTFFMLDISFHASQNNINHYCLWFGPKPYITITDPEDIKV